jgi:hypothetical protein
MELLLAELGQLAFVASALKDGGSLRCVVR